MKYLWLEVVLDAHHFSDWLSRFKEQDIIGFPSYRYGGCSSPISNYLSEQLRSPEGYSARVSISQNQNWWDFKTTDPIPPITREFVHHSEGAKFTVPPFGFYVDWKTYPDWKMFRDVLDIPWVVRFLTKEFERKDDSSFRGNSEVLRGEIHLYDALEWFKEATSTSDPSRMVSDILA